MFPLIALLIATNNVHIPAAPGWLKESRVEKVTRKIERTLEWDIRKVNVVFHSTEDSFSKAHGLKAVNARIMAVSKKSENAIHLGPGVDSGNFDGVFGHELAHVVMYQKYKDAIPKWLEEGLANFASRPSAVDYAWLASQAQPDIKSMGHPFGETAAEISAKYHYMASTAAIEMIASRCPIHDLLQLSVGAKLESYLATFCEISDLNAEFSKWVQKKAKR